MRNPPTLYAGIDGGGTKCSAMLFDHQGQVLGRGRAGAANVARDLPTSLISIVDCIKQALEDAKLPADLISQVKVGAGLAGACVPEVKSKLQAWAHPFTEFKVESDLTTACLGAHAGQDGALLIVGTGSSAARYQNGQLTQLGGHGFLLGDKGSGAWLGRMAVSATLEALDGIIATTQLHKQVQESLGLNTTSAIVQRMINASPSDFATLAPLVLALAKQQQPSALALVAEAVAYLDKLCQQCLNHTDLSIVVMGGVAPLLIPEFSQATRERIVSPKGGPEWGAVRLLQSDFPLVPVSV
ncbi:BadF/BadG/BcrA/BcrD ATPase family protein [Paraglaciecola aestuariivivens]